MAASRTLTRILSIITFAFAISLPAIGQTAFLEDEQGGTAIIAAAGVNKEAYSLGGGAGFSIKGKLDVRLAFAVITFPDIDNSGTVFAPIFEFHALKSNTQIPVSFAPGFSLASVSFDNLSSINISIFANFYRNLPITDQITFQPSYRPGYVYSIASTGGQEIIARTWHHSISLAFSFKVSSTTLLVISPGVSLATDITTWGIELAPIF